MTSAATFPVRGGGDETSATYNWARGGNCGCCGNRWAGRGTGSGDGPDDPLAGRTIGGVANIGLRPTVGGLVPRLEAHLFDIDVDLYGRHLRVALADFIRPEQKFAGLDALKSQIAADAARARAILAAAPRF